MVRIISDQSKYTLFIDELIDYVTFSIEIEKETGFTCVYCIGYEGLDSTLLLYTDDSSNNLLEQLHKAFYAIDEYIQRNNPGV